MPKVHVVVTLDTDSGNVLIEAHPAIGPNRVMLYGLLSMGMELVHRMADPKPKTSDIIIPELRIDRGNGRD